METDSRNKYNPQIHHRRSVRLKTYDYSQNGAYFITICTHEKQMLFNDDKINGIIKHEWQTTANVRDDVVIDEFVIMPNHFHGIIVITHPMMRQGGHESMHEVGQTPALGTGVRLYLHGDMPPQSPPRAYIDTPLRGKRKFRSPSQTIGAIVRGFKAASTTKINIMRNTPRQPVWQRNYYEHKIRNDNDLYEIRKYINDNPAKWNNDEYNPARRKQHL